PDGKKVFVWNALPGETLLRRLIKQKHSFAEAIAEEVVVASPDRTAAREANFLATSPWQIMTFTAETRYKKLLVQEVFDQAKLAVPDFVLTGPEDSAAYGYRNKMEYSFWGDDSGLHLALHYRGSHGKQAVEGCALAMPGIDQVAQAVRAHLA